MEFVLMLLREDINRTEKLSLRDAAEMMRPFHTEGGSLAEFVDTNTEESIKTMLRGQIWLYSL
jgi:hypothetical protein